MKSTGGSYSILGGVTIKPKSIALHHTDLHPILLWDMSSDCRPWCSARMLPIRAGTLNSLFKKTKRSHRAAWQMRSVQCKHKEIPLGPNHCKLRRDWLQGYPARCAQGLKMWGGLFLSSTSTLRGTIPFWNQFSKDNPTKNKVLVQLKFSWMQKEVIFNHAPLLVSDQIPPSQIPALWTPWPCHTKRMGETMGRK